LVEAAPQTFWPGGSGIYYRGAPLGISFRNFVFARHPARWRFWGFALGFPSGGMGMGMEMMAPLVLTLKPRNGDGTCSCNYATSNCEGEMANGRW